jgi:hypothetical protein
MARQGASTGAILAIERLRHATLVADRRDFLAEIKVRRGIKEKEKAQTTQQCARVRLTLFFVSFPPVSRSA